MLDTSTILVLERILDFSRLPGEPLMTAVTLTELSVGPLVAIDPGEQSIRQARLQQAEADFDPLPFDAAAARAFGRVVASVHRAGRKAHACAYDAMIVATAFSNNLPLDAQPSGLRDIDELDLRPISHPDTTGN